MNGKIPQYLFHYTSIRNLALILKRKEIRLSSLSTVDDVSEASSRDVVNFGQYVFVTCWTSLEEESIPFWHMYTSEMQGVRIKIPRRMFKQYPIVDVPEHGLKKEGDGYSVLPFEKSCLDNCIVMPDAPNNFFPIEYTDKNELLHPSLYKREPDGGHSIALGQMGKYKSSHWQFQSEWRLKLIITPGISMPNDFIENKDSMNSYLLEAAKIIEGKSLGFDGYSLELDDNAFREMEITLGPKQHLGDRIIVESLLNECNPSAKLINSSLKG